ncbi:MAG: type-F conjugative transfer system protein TraW [Chromatiales bacterium]|nr:type-F conjugative transfer system protein TraW [Chromatiales bacterium]
MLIACSEVVVGEDLGVVGPLYPIAESDFLAVIESRLSALAQSGELGRLEQGMAEAAVARAGAPRGATLPRATLPRVRLVDPSVVVPQDIVGADGVVLHAAGTRVNPLAHMVLSRRLVLFDGTDARQVAWAEALTSAASTLWKPVLTAGSPFALGERWGRWVYFDQGGFLVQRLGIVALPAVVSQAGERLRIEELPVEEGAR